MSITNKLFDHKYIDHTAVLERLIRESSPRKTFQMLIIVSSVIAALGLLNDSAPVVIGAMLVAPLLWPVLGLSMGILVRDWRMIKLSIMSILLSIVFAVTTAVIITQFYIPLGTSVQILQQTSYSFMLPVAIAAGIAASFALVYESVREAVTGVAISVALLPPLVTVGIGLGGTNWEYVIRATEVFLVNLLGILVTSFIIFALQGFVKFRKAAEVAAKKEEKILKQV
jgi:uncharacterized hydrophobic protein (TIGR00271 family)